MQQSVKGEECWESKDQTELLCQEAVQQEAFTTMYGSCVPRCENQYYSQPYIKTTLSLQYVTKTKLNVVDVPP